MPDRASTPPGTDGADQGSSPQQQRSPNTAPGGASAAAARDRQDAQAKARAAAQRDREKAAARQAKARAAAQKRAAQAAAATVRTRTSWESHDRPAKMIVLRPRSVDLVTNGALTRQVPRSGGGLSLPALSRLVPREWLTVNGDTADLFAAIVLTPAMSLTLGPDVKTVRLAGGPAASNAASIYTGSGRVLLNGVTVSSFDAATGQPLPLGPGRPAIAASGGGRLEVADSTLSDLGSDPADPAARPAVSFGQGSTGSLVRTTLARSGTALKLGGSTGVRLQELHISDSTGDGMVLRADTGTTFAGVTSDHNGGNGVAVNQPSTDRPITGISVTGNKLFGLNLAGQTKGEVNGVATADNGIGGVRVGNCTGMTIDDLVSTNDAIGLYTHVGSGQIAVNRAHITGARRGVQIEKTTHDLTINAATIDAASLSGIAVGGKHVTLNQVAINDSATAMRVERGSSDVIATGLTVAGGDNGIVALAATQNVALHNLTTNDVSRVAVRNFSPNLHIVDSQLIGSRTGIDTGAATVISKTTVVASDAGIRSRSLDSVTVDNADVSAVSVGVDVAPGSPVRLVDSRVDALEAIRGSLTQAGVNQLSLPPMNLLGAVGVPLILLAVALEQVHAFRHRSAPKIHRQPATLPAGAA